MFAERILYFCMFVYRAMWGATEAILGIQKVDSAGQHAFIKGQVHASNTHKHGARKETYAHSTHLI